MTSRWTICRVWTVSSASQSCSHHHDHLLHGRGPGCARRCSLSERPLEQLHHEVEPPVPRHAVVEHRHDPRVAEQHVVRHLAEEAGAELLVPHAVFARAP
ncbi:MAG: hypothetical protein IPK80_01925 [Nannocystis sp.]|nr:hypothetical protein [Nannocystis sp.]